MNGFTIVGERANSRGRINLKRALIGCALMFFCTLAKSSPAEEYTENLAELMQQEKVINAMLQIEAENQRQLQELIMLTEIPAPPFGEQARGKAFAEMLEEAGLTDVKVDEVGNVIGRRPGVSGDKTIVIAAHLDTVFPIETDVKVRREGDKYLAPGIGDNSRGLVVILGILRALEKQGIHHHANVLFVGNVGEEGLGDLRGVKHLFRPGAEKIDAFIGIDGGRNNRLIYGGVGSHRYKLTYSGPGGHSWGAFGMANPHHALGRAIALFDAGAVKVTSEGDKTTYNVGRIGGGTSINSIPFESWAEIDLRSGNQAKLDEIDAVLQQTAKQALIEENKGKSRGPDLDMTLARIGTRPAGLGDPNSSLVQHALAAMTMVNLEPNLSISSTDANIPISLNIPAITLSRGGVGGRAHSLDEWWQNKDAHIALQTALLVLLAEAKLAN